MSSDELAAQFCSVTGLEDAAQAAMYLEMAGGNLETAVMLFFDSGGAPAAAPAPSGGGAGSGGGAPTPPPDWFRAIWPRSVSGFDSIPDSWSGQSLTFAKMKCPGSASSELTIGLDQPKNGPCGVIAAVQAACVAESIRRGDVAKFGKGPDVTDGVLATVLSNMIWQARPSEDAPAKLATKSESGVVGGDPGAINDFKTKQSLYDAIEGSALIHDFKGPGGPILLVYSLVLTRTVEKVRADVTGSGGDLPLVTDNLHLCTSDLVSLCLRGQADGNVGAFLPISDENGENVKRDWPEALGVGLLSLDENQTKIPVADALKSPKYPVWVCHGGDHFTVLWTESLEFPKLSADDDDDGEGGSDDKGDADDGGVKFSVLHWNGLPPNGPRLGRLNVCASRESAPAPKKRKALKQYEPVTGEIESIVQADPAMKKAKPDGWTEWRYEVQLANDETKEEGTKYDKRPEGSTLPPTFDLAKYPAAGTDKNTWRCAACYSTRFKTMCFGMNDVVPGVDDPKCENCGRARSVAGWTVWLTYEQLPDSWKGSADRQFAPKIVTLLRTKWPGCDVGLVDDERFGAGTWPSI